MAATNVQGLLNWTSDSTPAIQGDHSMTKLIDYLLTAAAAEYLGVAQNTIRKWAARGDIPMHRNPANGYRLFRRSDLDWFLKKAAKSVNRKN